MLHFSKKSELKKAIAEERKVIDSYTEYEQTMKETIEKYLSESKNVSFDNEALKTMLFNNFENATIQIDNNLTDIESLTNVLDILESQKNVEESDTETYNRLDKKAVKSMELTQNFIQQTIACFENVSITGKKKSITTIEECKKTILEAFPFAQEEKKKNEEVSKKTIKNLKSIQKNFDYSSSDLLCFFPKSKDENLVISTVQDNYKISFNDSIATIYIEDENFNISLATSGVQISNSNTNNILFVSHSGSKYTIITNNQIEIPFFIHVSKVNKNEDFLEIEITRDSLILRVEDNILNFEEGEVTSAPQKILEEEVTVHKKAAPAPIIDEAETDIEEDVEDEEIIEEPETAPVITPISKVAKTFVVSQNIQPEEAYDVAKDFEPAEAPKDIPAVAAAPITPIVPEAAPIAEKQEKHIKKTEVAKLIETPVVENAVILPGVTGIDETASQGNDDDIPDNDTLIISDANKTVILPYKVADLRKKLQKSKTYKTLKDVVDKEYTIPLETFKNPVKSRFREAFQLIKKKEHGSVKEAVGLGLELMFQSNLNPAIIAACRDLDELDIYLDCLDDNELEKFSCFKISYSIPPTK